MKDQLVENSLYADHVSFLMNVHGVMPATDPGEIWRWIWLLYNMFGAVPHFTPVGK